jgi:hypothetical protein
MLFGDILVSGVGVAFVVTLTLLSILTLVGNGQVQQLATGRLGRYRIHQFRRVISGAVGKFPGLLAKAATRTPQSGSCRAIATEAKGLGPKSPYPFVHDNTRPRMVDITARVSAVTEFPTRGLKPVFGLLHDPQFAGTLEDVAGLYLSPPEHALVLCCDEGRPLRVVDRTRPEFADQDGSVATTVNLHGILGSTPLSDALRELCNSVIGSCEPRERHTEWMKFLRQVDRQTSRIKQLHVICDNYATSEHPGVQEWLAAHPRFHIHLAPGSGSGLKLVKRFFNDMIAGQLGLGAFRSVPDLTAAISRRFEVQAPEPMPFVWVTSGNDLLRQAAAVKSRPRIKRMGVKQIAALNIGLHPSLIREMFAASSA